MTFFDFLSLKNDENVPSKSNNQKNCKKNICFFVGTMTKIAGSGSESGSESGSGSNGQKHGPTDTDPHPDPHQNVVDRNTGW